jgi:adenine-specific DNA-methyltransferase
LRVKPGQKLAGQSMEQVIRAKKVLWPKHDKVVTFESLEQLLTAIDAGKAPRHIRQGLPDLDFWVGRPIGYGMPRYKMHKSELDATHNPLSTWLASRGDKEELAEGTDTGTVEVGSTAEGASLLTAMLGTKDFPYPKPLSLTQALIQQSTRPGDIIVDFFAGSGTTGHAVLALNEEDGGNRRFILASSTEVTEKMPDRNVCRAICQRRIEKAIRGYNYTTKKGLKEVPGLGGDVAYLRCRRLSPDRLTEIDHAQVWTALQLIHCETVGEYRDAALLEAGDDEQLLVYVPRFRRSDANKLVEAVKGSRAVIVYSWQPELIRQQLRGEPHVQVEAVPESLARRFGIKV